MIQLPILTNCFTVSFSGSTVQFVGEQATALQEVDPKLIIVREQRYLKEFKEAMKSLNFKGNIIKVTWHFYSTLVRKLRQPFLNIPNAFTINNAFTHISAISTLVSTRNKM